MPSKSFFNPPFLILKVRHPAVTGVYCIVGVVVVKCLCVWRLCQSSSPIYFQVSSCFFCRASSGTTCILALFPASRFIWLHGFTFVQLNEAGGGGGGGGAWE